MSYALSTRLKKAVKNAGVEFKEVSGWQSRGHGSMGVIQSVICHHTAGPAKGDTPSLNVVKNGRAGLPGPLAQLFLSRSGVVYIVAAGVSYHAGRVKSNVYSNAHAIGIEAEATGTSSWPSVQIEAYAKLCKALCREFNISTNRVVGHKEACYPAGRKIDPNFSMSDFRKKVNGAKGGVSTSTGSTGSSKTYKTVKYGTTLGLYDKGDPVKEWQSKALGYDSKKADSYFGPSTKADTVKWQKLNGLDPDGLVGDKTWAKYKSGKFKKLSDKASSSSTTNKPKKTTNKNSAPKPSYSFPLPSGYYFGSKSGGDKSVSGFYKRKFKGVTDQAWLKRFVNQLSKRGWSVGKGKSYLKSSGNDGLFGSEYSTLVKAFQKDQGLKVDGLLGKNTWDAAFKNPVK